MEDKHNIISIWFFFSWDILWCVAAVAAANGNQNLVSCLFSFGLMFMRSKLREMYEKKYTHRDEFLYLFKYKRFFITAITASKSLWVRGIFIFASRNFSFELKSFDVMGWTILLILLDVKIEECLMAYKICSVWNLDTLFDMREKWKVAQWNLMKVMYFYRCNMLWKVIQKLRSF